MSVAVHKFVQAASTLKCSEGSFPQGEQLEEMRKSTRDAFRTGYLTYVQQTDPQLIEKVNALQAELKEKSFETKSVHHATRDFISLNCRHEDLPFYRLLRTLDKSETAILKIIKWLQKPKNIPAQTSITRDEVLILATRFVLVIEMFDTKQGKEWRSDLKSLKVAVRALKGATETDPATILKNAQCDSYYVSKMATHFAKKE